MTTQQIIDRLTAGDYTIEAEGECACSFDWRHDGSLIPDHSGADCWYGDVLYMSGPDGPIMIASTDISNGLQVHVPDPAGEILAWIREQYHSSETLALQLSDYDGDNPIHNNAERAALEDWLTERITAGCRLYRDNERGFSNEYTSVIAGPDADADDDWDEQTPEQWADDYLYTGDAATQAYNSSRVIGTI